ncbi:MAG TPA: hypothetical protein VKU44_06495 [Terriglobia bacterium]|jgi:uncharacterized protein (DUF1778 family)|nr:hypothetical protein [Terriglobia bacterium]
MRETKKPSRRPQGRSQTEPVLLRFEPTHLEMIDHAAEHLGLARASWIRSTLLQAAREVLKEAS